MGILDDEEKKFFTKLKAKKYPPYKAWDKAKSRFHWSREVWIKLIDIYFPYAKNISEFREFKTVYPEYFFRGLVLADLYLHSKGDTGEQVFLDQAHKIGYTMVIELYDYYEGDFIGYVGLRPRKNYKNVPDAFIGGAFRLSQEGEVDVLRLVPVNRNLHSIILDIINERDVGDGDESLVSYPDGNYYYKADFETYDQLLYVLVKLFSVETNDYILYKS